MNRIEIKLIMTEFKRNANRLLQANYRDYVDDLKKFVSFLERTEIIYQYINNCGGYKDNTDEVVNSVISNYGHYFLRGDTEEEEVSNIYSAIKYIEENYKEIPLMILSEYSSSRKCSDMLKAFNDRFVSVLIGNIDNYLTKVGIQMGLDDNVVYNINGNQVNIANDNATINAVQTNNGIDIDNLSNLISAMREGLSEDLSEEDVNEANDSIDVIERELSSGNPNEDNVKTHFKLLKRIDAGVKFSSACCSLLTFADKIHPFLSQIIPWFQSVIK